MEEVAVLLKLDARKIADELHDAVTVVRTGLVARIESDDETDKNSNRVKRDIGRIQKNESFRVVIVVCLIGHKALRLVQNALPSII